MVENIDHKLESKDKLINFYNENKLKLLLLIGLLLIIITTSIFLKVNKDKQNILASEKYMPRATPAKEGCLSHSNLSLQIIQTLRLSTLYREILGCNIKLLAGGSPIPT